MLQVFAGARVLVVAGRAGCPSGGQRNATMAAEVRRLETRSIGRKVDARGGSLPVIELPIIVLLNGEGGRQQTLKGLLVEHQFGSARRHDF